METALIIIGAIVLILLLSVTGYLFKILGYILEFIMGGVSNFFGCIFRLIMTLIIGYIITLSALDFCSEMPDNSE